MNPTVVALLVSHDGSRWLTAVVEGLRSQTVPLAGVVCVDTGSHDDSPDLLLDAFDEVVTVSGRTAYPEAVRIGLEQIPAEAAEWVWLLHDDSNPAPDALERLLAASAADPEADVLGPKLREWPSLKRLLEVGITISGTGRRETGLEAGEYDQGQHDEVRQVLAVNTAGMLVRRAVYERLGGLDDNLPMFGNDLDFGWRAATAGVRTVVVPDAVVFHAEAAHRGLRRTPLTGRHTHYHERRAALFTLLANAPARALPWQVVRLFFGTLLRMIGFLVVRSAGEALDDLAALFSVYAGPGEIRRARQARKAIGDHDPKPLLAPWWVPYRHGLDFVGDIAAAATNQAQDVADRRRAAKEAAAPAPLRRPVVVPDDDDAVAEDTGLVARFFTNPLAVALSIVVVLSIVGVREAFGLVTGGGLAPAPADAQALWRLWIESWHPLGTGTAIPAPATSYRWRCSGPCWATARPPRSRRCCCSPYPWRCGVPGVCSASWVVWSTRAARPAGWWPSARSPTPWCPSPPGPGATAASASSRPPCWCRGSRTPRSASPTPSPTAGGAPPGGPGCCSPSPPRSSRSPGSSRCC